MVSGACYVAASMSMVLMNKAVLSSFHFKCENFVVFMQCLTAVVLVKVLEGMGYVKVEPFNWEIVKVWMPVNLLFVGMLSSSFLALGRIGVAMVTILKNCTNLITIVGDYYLYGRTYGLNIWLSLGLIIIAAIIGSLTDPAAKAGDSRGSAQGFVASAVLMGYFWQILNCFFTAGYSLYMRGAMDKVKNYTSDRQKLGEFSMVFYNNLLTLGPVLALMFFFGEFSILPEQEAWANPWFPVAMVRPALRAAAGAVAHADGVVLVRPTHDAAPSPHRPACAPQSFSCLLGFLISFASLWFLSNTTPTIFSLVGSLNKVPLAFVGMVVFRDPTTPANIASICVGLLAGVFFAQAKSSSR